MRLGRSDARGEFTRAGKGCPAGIQPEADGRRVAFHLASPSGYQIWTCHLEGPSNPLSRRTEYLFFGHWSPDGSWLAFQDDADTGRIRT